MIAIVNINSQKFTLNGVPYFKNFIPHVINEQLRIVNIYDSKLTLCGFNTVDKYTVNGASYGDISALQNALLPVLYSRNTLGFTGGSIQELDRIVSLGTTDLVDDQVTFGVGFGWFLNQEYNANIDFIDRNLPLAAEGMYRTHVAYLNDANDILIQVGEESEEVTQEPSVPPGTLRLRAFNVFGDVVSLGTGPAIPYDINLLDELLQAPQDDDFFLINTSGIDFKIKWLWLNLMEFLKLKILSADPAVPAADRVNLYTLANTLAAQFPDGQTIKFLKNPSLNGVLQMPYYTARVETQRPVATITGTTSYTLQDTDTSRCLRAFMTFDLDFVIPTSIGGNQVFEIVNQSTGIVRLLTAGTYSINGSLDPIVLERNVVYKVKRVASLDYILTPKPGGGSVPDATNLVAGIMKMYAAYGSGVDGAIRQDFFTTEMAKKAVLGDQRTVVPVAGEYVNVTLASVNGVVVSSSALYYVGLTFLRDCVADSVQIVSGASSGNGDLKFGVYNSDSNQKPGNKAAECTISVSGTNTVQTGVFSTPVAITKGTHWFTFALGTNGNLVTTYGVNSPTTGNFLENRGGVGDNASRNSSYAVTNSPNTSLPSTVSTIVNGGVIMPKFALLISSVS